MIFRRYAELGSVTLLRAELDRLGIVSECRAGAGGRLAGGQRFSRGALYLMLQNRLYRGDIVHQGEAYPGQHEAILDPELWQIVQDKLAANRHERALAVGAEAPSLPLLAARRVLREKFAKLHRKVLLLARDNEVCQRLMTIPGVGPVVSLAFISTVDVPARFRNSKAVGPSLGLTPVLNQSGESHRVGRISLCGDEAMRALLYEAAQVMLTRVQKWSWLKAWAMNIAKRRGQKKAIVALARRLAVIMHRMWSDGTEFRWTREMAPTI